MDISTSILKDGDISKDFRNPSCSFTNEVDQDGNKTKEIFIKE